jgi:hypothetical protein
MSGQISIMVGAVSQTMKPASNESPESILVLGFMWLMGGWKLTSQVESNFSLNRGWL